MSDEILRNAAQFFTDHYGTWARDAAEHMGSFAEAGKCCSYLSIFPQCSDMEGHPVRLSKEKFRADYFPTGVHCTYVHIIMNKELAGQVCACRWVYDGKQICWVTQLVVHSQFREKKLATRLLEELREERDDVYGIMSSHPAACLAATKAFGGTWSQYTLDVLNEIDSMQNFPWRYMDQAKEILNSSPIRYVKEAKVYGRFFRPENEYCWTKAAVNTNFWVDHGKCLRALSRIYEEKHWPLGDLLSGQEFLLILTAGKTGLDRSSVYLEGGFGP